MALPVISMTAPGGTPVTQVTLPDGTQVATTAAGVALIPAQFVSTMLNAGWSFTSASGT